MAVPEEPETVPEEIEWTAENEVQLFHAMRGHKPVGINKYFQMACIIDKFQNFINKDVSSKAVWSHLDSMYDMQSLDDIEHIPFPNEECEFGLPEAEFATFLQGKKGYKLSDNLEEESDSKNDLGQVGNKNTKDVNAKRENSARDTKSIYSRREIKENVRDSKKLNIREWKEPKRENKDIQEGKREYKRSDGKKDSVDGRETKVFKPRGSMKEKKEEDREETKKDRVKDTIDAQNEDATKRSGKRSVRGVIKSDDTGSNKSSSPIAVPALPPSKRRRT